MKKAIESIYSKWRDVYSGAILVEKSKNIIFSAASGEANMAWGIANTMSTRFDIASVTKIFTAASILLLIEEGLLCFDDKITDVIDLDGTQIPKDVTIEQLMNHTSGIADDVEEEDGEDYSELFITKPNYSIRECVDFLPQFAHKYPNFKAGTNVRYNNCAFVLLGLAIEKISGMPYREFVVERVFEKCKMQNTFFCAMDEINPNTAEGYFSVVDSVSGKKKWKKNIYSYPPVGTADSGAYTTVADLAVFIRTIINEEFLTSSFAKTLLKPHCTYSKPHCFGTWTTGYAFEFILTNERDVFCMFKDGINAGVQAMISYYPQYDAIVSLLANKNSGLYDIHKEIQAYFYNLQE